MKISHCFEYLEFEANETVFEQGSTAQSIYLIKTGSVKVTHSTGIGPIQFKKDVATLKSGECFGEMGILTHNKRNATVTCLEKSTMYVLKLTNFNMIFDKNMSFKDALEKIANERLGN